MVKASDTSSVDQLHRSVRLAIFQHSRSGSENPKLQVCSVNVDVMHLCRAIGRLAYVAILRLLQSDDFRTRAGRWNADYQYLMLHDKHPTVQKRPTTITVSIYRIHKRE